MFANFINIFIEIVHAVFLHPAELSIYLQKIPALVIHALTVLLLASFSSSLSLYILRDYYEANFILVIPLMSAAYLVFYLLWAVIQGSVIDALVNLKHPDRYGRSWKMISIVIFSLLPFAFSTPLAMTVRFFAERLHWNAVALMTPFSLFLVLWSLYISLRGLQYLYELTFRAAFATCIRSLVVLVLFPVLAGLVMTMKTVQLLN